MGQATVKKNRKCKNCKRTLPMITGAELYQHSVDCKAGKPSAAQRIEVATPGDLLALGAEYNRQKAAAIGYKRFLHRGPARRRTADGYKKS